MISPDTTQEQPEETAVPVSGHRSLGPAANAVKHGLTATKLLPHLLRPERLEELRGRLRQEYRPSTITGELLVSEAARHAAALEMLECAEPAVMRQAVQTLEMVMQAQQHSQDWELAAAVTGEPLDRCARYRRAHEKSLHQALDKLGLLAATKPAGAGDQPSATAPALASELDCQRYLRRYMFAAAWRCPRCKSAVGHWLDSRQVWQCAQCDKQVGLRHGTVFGRSSLPLLAWFTAIRLYAAKADIDATNYRAEQALRPAVVNRKVWGGNRTLTGAKAQATLTSLLVTLSQRGSDALEWFSMTRRSSSALALPP